MFSRTIIIGTLTCLLCACAAKTPATDDAVVTAKIGEITAGTRREEHGPIADNRSTFKTFEQTLLFDVQLTEITEPTKVRVSWFIEDDTGPFSQYSATVSSTTPILQLELPRDNDWPADTYTMLVEAGNTAEKQTKIFQYTIEE